MRMILELPHDVTDYHRERILCRFCDCTFASHAPFHAVIHKPAKGNDARMFHAHITWACHEFVRDPETRLWTLPPQSERFRVTEFDRVLTTNGKGAARHKAMSDAFRTMRSHFVQIANDALKQCAAARRYDHRSYSDQGIEAHPGFHLGLTANAAHKNK